MTPDQRAELSKRIEIILATGRLLDARRAALNEMIREEEIEIEKILFMEPSPERLYSYFDLANLANATARLTLLLAERSRG